METKRRARYGTMAAFFTLALLLSLAAPVAVTPASADGPLNGDEGAQHVDYQPGALHLHSVDLIDPLVPVTNPECTQWHELCPVYCNEYHLERWQDNHDGVLSPCDHIALRDKETGESAWYHVDEVTVTILVVPEIFLEPVEPMYLEFEGGYELIEQAIIAPVCTLWRKVCADYDDVFHIYHLMDWIDGILIEGVDGVGEGKLSYCDLIRLHEEMPMGVEEDVWYHVEEVTIDIIVSPIVDKIPPTTQKEYGEPYYTDGVNEWITADTPIYLNATDEVGGDYTKYRVWYNGEWTDWLTYTGPFTMAEIGEEIDCLHKIEYYSVDKAGNEESWHEVMVEADAAEFEAYSALAVDPFALRTTHVVYTEEASQDLIYKMSPDFGKTWTGRTVLVSGLAKASEPDIEISPNGDIHVVFIGYLPGQQQRISHIWYDFAANNYGYENATDPANWEDRVLVDDTGRDNVYPQIAIDSLNDVHCVWIGDSDGVESGGAQDIFYSMFDGSTWSPRITLYANATTTPGWPNPQIIAEAYVLHVVFLDSNEHMMKYLTYRITAERHIKGKDSGGNPSGEWGSYYGGIWSPAVADNVGNSSASYGTVAGMAIEGNMLHIAWQDVRNGDGEVYENTRDLTTTDAFGPEWQITFEQYIDDDGTSVGETLMESGKFDNLHLFYRDSVGYDIWYMEYHSVWSQPVKVADSGPEHMHLWSEMTVDIWDSPLLTYTKATNDYTEFDTYYKKPYRNQIVYVDNTPPATTKKVSDTTITLEARDNCRCEKWAILVAGPDPDDACMAHGFENDVDEMERMLRTKCQETGGWKSIEKLTGTRANKEELKKQFKRVATAAEEERCCLFFFYYSGHGSGYHKDDGYADGGIDMTCKGEPGEQYNEKDFKISMTQEEWGDLAEDEGYPYDTDGDGVNDMIFGKHNGVATLAKGKPSDWDWDNPIGEDTDDDRDIDSADGGADLNRDGDKDDTFCINEDMCLSDPNKNEWGPSLYDDQFAELIQSVCKCKNTVIVIDACHSGGFIPDILRKNPDKPMVIVTSCQEDEYANSWQFFDKDGNCICGWGWYNHWFTLALKTSMSVEEAHKWGELGVILENPISWLESEGWVEQHPQIYDSHKEKPKFLYCCGVGLYKIHCIIWHNGEPGPEHVGELNQPVSFELTEPGEYIIEYWAVDVLGNGEEHHFQTHYVDTKPPENAEDYPRYEVGEQNPDGTYQVTITDALFDTDSGVKKVVAKVDGTVEFEADDISLPEYEFSFVVNLDPGAHTLAIEAWDVVGNHLQKVVDVIVTVQATINIDPDTLNLRSKGKWITAYIELPQGYVANDIDVATVFLNDVIQAEPKPVEIGDYNSNGISDLMVKFDRAAVQRILTIGNRVEISICGEVAGIVFQGSDSIRVINK